MDTLVPERCVIFCWHACYEDVPSFLELLKLKVQPYIVLMDNSYYNFYHYIMKCKAWKTHRKIPSQYRQYCLCTQCRQLSTDISVRQDQLCWFIFRHADNSLYDGYVVNRLVSVITVTDDIWCCVYFYCRKKVRTILIYQSAIFFVEQIT